MFTLPPTITRFLNCSNRTLPTEFWSRVRLLVVGAILAPGQRTVTAILRIWIEPGNPFSELPSGAQPGGLVEPGPESGPAVMVLLATFVPMGPVVLGLDDTIERRRGAKIRAKGIYRDPVRSSQSHFVKASGLRWLSLMLLTQIPWAKACGRCPF